MCSIGGNAIWTEDNMTSCPKLPARPGTYVLGLRNNTRIGLEIGSLGRCVFPQGWYFYVGSAFGPGGLAARAGRHLKPEKPCLWHIDYLTAVLPVSRVWISTWPERLECSWASILMHMGGQIPVKRFGASDCRCPGHLLRFGTRPSLNRFRAISQNPVRSLVTG